MSVSQFTKYTSSDASGPGVLTGAAGTLLALLDACLVNGYSGKTAAGWTKPYSNSSNSGCYKQGAGAGFGVVINDNGGNATSTYKEAWATGWQTITAVTAPVGTGSGQFPTAAQLNTSGYVGVRKSASADSTGRAWVLFADASTFYLFVASGDTTGHYMEFMFGDFYALAGASGDPYRCAVVARSTPNSGSLNNTSGTMLGAMDFMENPSNGTGGYGPGLYIANNLTGSSGSLQSYVYGDLGKATSQTTAQYRAGLVPCPNPYDNSFYMSPVFLADVTLAVRGYFRGLYHVCHPNTSFTDGQTFNGAGDFSGKTFQIVSLGSGQGYHAIETSNTVPTD